MIPSPKTQPMTDKRGIPTNVWSAWFDELTRNPVKVITSDSRFQAGQETYVLDGTSNTVDLTLPASLNSGAKIAVACVNSDNACSVILNGNTFYSDAGPLSIEAGEFYYLKWNGSLWVGFKGNNTGGVSDHNSLSGLQGGTTNEYYHLTSADYTEAVSFLDGGTNTHTQVDTAISNSVSHIADSTIHFTESSIDHAAIQNIGTNTHAQIDTHIADSTIHNPFSGLVTEEYDERTYTYTARKLTQTLYKLASSTVLTVNRSYDSSDRPSTITNGTNTLTLSYDGTGKLASVVKT